MAPPSALKENWVMPLNMRTILACVVMSACVVSPALADVYKCNSGNRTTYQDEPCPNAKVIDNINGQAPSRHEQMKAMERATREQALAGQLGKVREAEGRSVTTPQTRVSPSPVAPKPNRPDRYYDRPDRYSDRPDKYKNRTVNDRRTIQSQ